MNENCKTLLRKNLRPKVFRVKHLDCTPDHCKTVTIDFSNHLIWLTVVVAGQAVSRIAIDFESYNELVEWVGEIFQEANNKYCSSLKDI